MENFKNGSIIWRDDRGVEELLRKIHRAESKANGSLYSLLASKFDEAPSPRKNFLKTIGLEAVAIYTNGDLDTGYRVLDEKKFFVFLLK